MIGSFVTRCLVMILGYAYPAYECFKTVERNKPEIEQLRFWCQYWILVAVLTVCERVGDAFISWIPMYSEAKVAFFVYLWYPRTKGTTYVYDSFFRPYIAKHETEIDRNLSELRTRAGDVAVLYCQRAATYGQTRVFEVLQYIASQSTPNPRPQKNPSIRTDNRKTMQPPKPAPAKAEPPAQPAKEATVPSLPSNEQQKDGAREASAEAPESSAQPSEPLDSTEEPKLTVQDAMQVEVPAPANDNAKATLQELLTKNPTGRRLRLRKTRSAGNE